jgi:hypothetical protein
MPYTGGAGNCGPDALFAVTRQIAEAVAVQL